MPKGKPHMYAGGGLIKSLRSAHDPHFKLEGRVGGLEKGLGIETAQLHKTLSKSFAMQRKTLVRVLGLEKRVAELEAQKVVLQDVVEDVIDDGIDIDDEVPIPQEVEGERPAEGEVGGDDKPSSGVSTLIDPPKRIKVKRKKIKAADIKKGTALDDDFTSRVMGTDGEGGYLSKEDRIARFKGETPSVDKLKPVEEEGNAQNSNPFAGVGSTLTVIADTVDSIYKTLQDQFKLQEDAQDDARVKGEEKDVKAAEKDLEKKGGLGLGKGIKDTAAKVFKPFMSIWDRFVQFFVAIVAGKTIMKALDWFGNPENASKVSSIFRFIKDWWPVLLGSLMWFLPGLLGPAGMVAGTIALLMWGVPKILDAVKFVTALPGQIMNWITGNGNKELDKVEDEAVNDITKDVGDKPTADPPPVDAKEIVPNPTEAKGFNKGGEVPGAGDKDTVPAMLTPGEFVMSKGAVEQYGIDTMEGMNAAAGGTNIPTMQTGGGKGKNLGIPRFGGGGMSKKQQIMRQTDSDGTFGESGSSISTSQATPEQRKQQYADMGMPSMELWDGSVVPDIGKIGAEKIPAALEQTRQNMVETGASPERIAKLDELIASPDVQPAALQNSLNRLVPGSTEQVLGDMGDSITASAKMNGGGLVQHFNNGGLVQHFNNGGLVKNIFDGANTMFNMLPQVQAAKFVGGKAQGMFNRGKEFIGKPFDKSVNIPPPTSNDQKVTIIQQTNTSSKEPSELGGSSIPAFPVVYPAMKKNKQKLLGISV
jgi:hypothetical protein